MINDTTPIRRPLLLFAILLAALGCLGSLASPAHAYIYWTDLGGFGSGDIGRANLDYSGKDRRFIRGGIGPSGIAVDAKHVYWLNYDGGAVGRARLDGTHVQHHFIDGIGFALDIEVDGDYIYWSHGSSIDSTAGIARASLDGTQVVFDFVAFGDQVEYTTPAGLDVNDGYIYWANAYPTYTIGRAAVDGTDVNQNFIAGPGLKNPFGLAVTDTTIYWGNRGRHEISRAAIDGTAVELDFITGVGRIGAIAADDRFLYWPGPRYSLIRSRLDGTGLKALSEHRFHADSIAIDALGPS